MGPREEGANGVTHCTYLQASGGQMVADGVLARDQLPERLCRFMRDPQHAPLVCFQPTQSYELSPLRKRYTAVRVT